MTKIVIIDDNEAILEVVKIALDESGYEVITSTKGESFIPTIAKIQPAVVLLDLLLSGEDGGEVAKALRKNKDTKNIPIILISADPSAEKVAKDGGIGGFLSKPFDLDRLLAVVNDCVCD